MKIIKTTAFGLTVLAISSWQAAGVVWRNTVDTAAGAEAAVETPAPRLVRFRWTSMARVCPRRRRQCHSSGSAEVHSDGNRSINSRDGEDR